MPRYEVVLFDADHTLFDFDRAEREALRQTLEEAGLPRRRGDRGALLIHQPGALEPAGPG